MLILIAVLITVLVVVLKKDPEPNPDNPPTGNPYYVSETAKGFRGQKFIILRDPNRVYASDVP